MQLITKSVVATLLFSSYVFAQAPETGKPEDTTGALGDAKVNTEDPSGPAYWADFSGTKLSGGLKFYPTKEGVRVEVAMRGFPTEGGPFTYHVHDQPVPSDGNCTGTKAHLDPFIRGQKVPCDPKRPQSCEVGDLAGKHGKIPADIANGTYTTSYIDKYITLEEGPGAFIGNRSIVVHLADGKRYACANVTDLEGPSGQNAGPRFTPGYWGCGLGVAVGLKFLLV
ncbi:superoxide dismutase [Kalaharituber pfeilii]|nr:superoxide dismutase [Kalaharituber pfeilii]